MPRRLRDALDFLGAQVFSRAGKAIKKLQWIPDTIMNIHALENFDDVYISDGVKTALHTHRLGNI